MRSAERTLRNNLPSQGTTLQTRREGMRVTKKIMRKGKMLERDRRQSLIGVEEGKSLENIA